MGGIASQEAIKVSAHSCHTLSLPLTSGRGEECTPSPYHWGGRGEGVHSYLYTYSTVDVAYSTVRWGCWAVVTSDQPVTVVRARECTMAAYHRIYSYSNARTTPSPSCTLVQ